MSERLDGDRITVTGYSGGSHFPRTQAEILSRFEADGRASPFEIDGAVYGRDVRLRGPGTLRGPLLGRGDVRLDNDGALPQRLLGGLHATGHVGCADHPRALAHSAIGGLGRAAYVVRGDVIGESVALDNALVLGNVRGRQVRLARCVVVGQVLAGEQAEFAASTVLSYEAPRVRLLGPCCLIFGAGVSEDVPEEGAWHDGTESWPAQLAVLPLLRAQGYEALALRPWEPPQGHGWRVWPSDFLRVTARRDVTRLRNGQACQEVETFTRHVLSLGGRILNFRDAERFLDHFVWLFRAAFEFEHYHPDRRRAMQARWREVCTADELKLLELTLGDASATGIAA